MIGTIDEFIKAVDCACDQLCKVHDQGCGKFYFRGQSDCAWGLQPGLFRQYRSSAILDAPCTYLMTETEIIQEVERHYPEKFKSCQNLIDKLTLLQHYGVPTRLLDVTANCLVALYFAVSERVSVDGRVYVFWVSPDEVRQSYDYETLERYSDIGGVRTKPPSEKVFARENGKLIELHPKIYLESNRQLDPLLVSPKYLSERQKRQSGSFFLLPNDKMIGAGERACLFDSFRISKIEISGSAKMDIRRELREQFGISRHFLFPESISDFVGEIKEEMAYRLAQRKIEEE